MKTNIKKVDNRIRVMIENCVATGHRSMFLLVGVKCRDHVVTLHHMLAKSSVKARPNILWCYKQDLGFSCQPMLRGASDLYCCPVATPYFKSLPDFIESTLKDKKARMDINEKDPFEMFIISTNIRYCYYSETHKILGNTFGMCVLADFEALTPNLLARTIETVEGGGIIVILLGSLSSLRQLYTMTMDVHSRYRTEAYQDVVGRFNERFILSLSSCKTCVVIDDQLNILPLSSHVLNLTRLKAKTTEDSLSPEDVQLKELKDSLHDTQPVGSLANCCKTLDQAKALLKFVEAISEKTLRCTVALTAARGRGKSAALGLAMAGAVAFSYSNIFVTSPSPENLTTLFEFILKGFDALEYQEHLDYNVIRSTNPEFNKSVIRVNIFRDHRQTIQYIHPSDAHKLSQAELVVIDEAAAIPLPLVKSLLGPYLVFMASTINGYEGTGRSLSLKLVQQLRQQTMNLASVSKETNHGDIANQGVTTSGRILQEVELHESIRYKNGDEVEAWLNSLLCLDATLVEYLHSGCPVPQDCELYYVSRDTLFSYHRASELFLQRLMALYVASHYKNSPNDLQMLSDAPTHQIFCLLGPVSPSLSTLPDILCVLQVNLEGAISSASVMHGLSRGKGSSGDLIPWTVAQQFQDQDFPSLSGARIVRIATHPNYQKMGYGSRALALLQDYYECRIMTTDEIPETAPDEIEPTTDESVHLLKENLAPKKSLPPLLIKLCERRPEKLHYLGVSYGLTSELLKFWKRNHFVPVYLRQTQNDLTGEHSCIMLKLLHDDENANSSASWLESFWTDFRRRFISLLGFQFRAFSPSLALSILTPSTSIVDKDEQRKDMSRQELEIHFTNYDLKRLDLYSRNMVDYHLITDLMPTLAKLYFQKKMPGVKLLALPASIFIGLALQYKTVDEVSKEMALPVNQVLGIFNRTIRKFVTHLKEIAEAEIASHFPQQKDAVNLPTKKALDRDSNEGARELNKKEKFNVTKLIDEDLQKYTIRGSDEVWQKALNEDGASKSSVTLKFRKKNKSFLLTNEETEFGDKTSTKKGGKKFGAQKKKFKR